MGCGVCSVRWGVLVWDVGDGVGVLVWEVGCEVGSAVS